jgi:ABC-2 type transport system ATP-binding protein
MAIVMPLIVQARHVTKWYGPRRAITDISFAVEAGELIGLLGPNGSGKSTLLRILTGYLSPSSGTVEVAGRDVVTDSIGVRREIGYVPEDAPLYDNMRVVEFLRFMANIKGLRREAVNRAVDAAATQLDLTRVMTMPAGKLSRGFRQRVSIAQALLADPKILVLDEPTSGLDPHQVIAVRELVRSLAGRHTILLASHVLPEIEKIATRVMIMLDGTLLAADALGGNADSRTLRLRACGPGASISAACAAVKGVRGVAIEAGGGDEPALCLIEAERRVGLAAEVAAALISNGIAVCELAEEPRDLERVFLDLTRRPVEAAA